MIAPLLGWSQRTLIWVRGHAYGVGGEWLALKLMNFSDRNIALREELKPKERTRINDEGEKEE